MRPLVRESEARVYEALILECDGWDRPTSVPVIASVTGLHLETVRKSIQALKRLRERHTANYAKESPQEHAMVAELIRRTGEAWLGGQLAGRRRRLDG